MMRLRKRLNLRGALARFTLVVFATASLLPGITSAASIYSRSLQLGNSSPGTFTTYKFTFTIPTTGNVGSIKFTFGTTAGGTTTPTGMDASAVGGTITQTGATGFSLGGSPTAGAFYITRTAASVSAGQVVSYTFSNIKNPTTANQTFFAIIQTYTGTDGATGPVDNGNVATSTGTTVNVTASVPETLTFCVYTGANCAAAGSSVAFGTLTAGTTASGTSKIDLATNAANGYNVTYYSTPGTQMSTNASAGTCTAPYACITNMAGTAMSSGSGFGINVPAGGGPAGYTGSNYTFNPGGTDNIITGSGPLATTTYTINYGVNVSATQAAGAYSVSVVYVCTATY